MATAPLISSSGAVSISSSGAISFGTSSSKCDCGCTPGNSCIICSDGSSPTYLKVEFNTVALDDCTSSCLTTILGSDSGGALYGHSQLKNLTLTSPIYLKNNACGICANFGLTAGDCCFSGEVGTVDIYASIDNDPDGSCDTLLCTVILILYVTVGTTGLSWGISSVTSNFFTFDGDPTVRASGNEITPGNGFASYDSPAALCDGVTTSEVDHTGFPCAWSAGGVYPVGGGMQNVSILGYFSDDTTATFTAVSSPSGGTIAPCSMRLYICYESVSPPDDCYVPMFLCIGTEDASYFLSCTDSYMLRGNAVIYSGKCYTVGINPVLSLPGGATLLSLSDLTPTPSCNSCVSPCYVQARQCKCDSTPNGNDSGALVDVWFLCTDIPSGGAFSVPVIGCCYIQQNNFIGPNPGFPDGSMTLGGTLYDSTGVTPSPSCADCIGCPDLTTAPATLTVVLSGIPNGLTGGISKDDALPCGTSTDGTYTLTKFGSDYGYSDGAFFGIGITCGSDGMGGHIWTMQVFGLAPGCPPSESSNCSFFATLPVGASPCYPHGTFSFTSKSDGCGDALGGTGVVS